MNEEMNYLKEKQKMSIALIASCAVEVLALLGVAFGVFEETAFYLTEIIAVIANLGLIVIPIEVLLWIRLLYLCGINNIKPKGALKKVLSIGTVLAVSFTCFSVFAFSQGFHSTKEIPDGSRKIAEDGKYYVMVGEQRIRLSEDRFQRMESGKSYSINYMWSRYYKEWTYVVYIEDETGNRF